MNTTERQRLEDVERAVDELWVEVSKRLLLDEESSKVFHRGLKLGVFLVNLVDYGKVIGSLVMGAGTVFLLWDKIIEAIAKWA